MSSGAYKKRFFSYRNGVAQVFYPNYIRELLALLDALWFVHTSFAIEKILVALLEECIPNFKRNIYTYMEFFRVAAKNIGEF